MLANPPPAEVMRQSGEASLIIVIQVSLGMRSVPAEEIAFSREVGDGSDGPLAFWSVTCWMVSVGGMAGTVAAR